MGGTTPNLALPYPTGTDRLMDGDDAIAALANALDTYIYRACPIGAILMWPTASAPASGWLICNGSTFSNATYPALATLLGDLYGVHSGANYYLPDFRVRVPMGVGSGRPLANNEGIAEGSRNANNSHVHTHPDHAEASNTTATASSNRVTSGAHSNNTQWLHPYQTINFIIRCL